MGGACGKVLEDDLGRGGTGQCKPSVLANWHPLKSGNYPPRD